MSMNYADIAAYQALTQRASASAQAAYNQSMAAGAGEDRALAQAKFEWQKKMDEATQTGMWNGQWSNPQQQWFTDQFGTWFGAGGAPGQQAAGGGATTLQSQQQAYQQAYNLASQYGQYFAPGQAPNPGMATQQAIQQASDIAARQAELTGWYTPPGVLNQQAGTAGATPLGTGYYVGGDHRIHVGSPGVGWGQAGWDPNTPGGGSGQQADPSWAVGSQVSDPSVLTRPTAQAPGGDPAAQAAAGGAGAQAERQQTLAGQQQQWSQGFQQQGFEAQQRQLAQTNAQNYLQMLSQLRGPADWAKYQQVLGSTPQGMRDLYAAAVGQYVPGGGATTGVQPQAADLYTMQQQIGGYNPQAQAQGGQVWGSGIGVGAQGATPAQQQQAAGNGTNMGGGYNMPAPNQISAQAWNNFTPTQQQLMLGNYEAAGWDKNDVQALYNQSLPKYATNASSAGTWRL